MYTRKWTLQIGTPTPYIGKSVAIFKSWMLLNLLLTHYLHHN